MKRKKIIGILGGCIFTDCPEIEDAVEIMEKEYGITFSKREPLAEMPTEQVVKAIRQAEELPEVKMLPAEKPKKIKPFVPRNVGKSVKRSQKPVYRYRRR